MDNGFQIWKYLSDTYHNDLAVAGIMGNLMAESSLRPDNLQNSFEKSLGMTDREYTEAVDNGTYTEEQFTYDRAGYGLAQWTYWSRKRDLFHYQKSRVLPIDDLTGQLGFLCEEVGKDRILLDSLVNASSIREASDAFMERYEKPADMSEKNRQRRADLGLKMLETYGGGNVITARALCDQCRIPLDEGWGYIWGASGQLWTQKDQDAATDATIKEYGQQWVGHRVCDCSGLFYWAFKELGGSIHHGSNSIWSEDCVNSTKGTLKDGARTDGKEIRPGSAVFLTRDEGGKKSRHHIGIYVGENTCIEAKGTKSGVVVSPLFHWDEVAELKNVSYDGEVVFMTLRKGCSGEDVKELQADLILHGYNPGTADGYFGSKTEAAVKAFQRDYGLTADGVVGPKTWAVLIEGTGMPNEPTEEEKPQEPAISDQYTQIETTELTELYNAAVSLANRIGALLGVG